jgi:hypothetical protein
MLVGDYIARQNKDRLEQKMRQRDAKKYRQTSEKEGKTTENIKSEKEIEG